MSVTRNERTAAPTAAAAVAFAKAGCSVLRVRADGSKAPVGEEWKSAQHTAAGEDAVSAWFNGGHPGVGVVTGAVSRNLEMFEFEGRAIGDGLHEQLQDLAEASGLGELWRKVSTGYRETTPGGGAHLLYRVEGAPVRPNTKLARRPSTPQELRDHQSAELLRAKEQHADDPTMLERRLQAIAALTVDKVPQVLIETRGEGGFVVTAPSNGPTHPSGRPWVLDAGGPDSIPTVTAEEYQALHDLARAFDDMPAPEPVTAPKARQPVTDGTRPGDRYNQLATWHELLVPHGWQPVLERGGTVYWRRPGKSAGVSASSGRNEHDRLYVFTTSTEFEANKPYDKLGALALLEHGGDIKAAARAIAADPRYSDRRPSTPETFLQRPGAPAPVTTADPPGAAPAPAAVTVERDNSPSRFVHGGTFTLDVPDEIPAVWGEGEQVAWATGESLMIVGPPGVGKSTLTQQIVLARIGVLPHVLGMPVTRGKRVLYLACDRPPQVQRSFRRMVRPTDREYLDEHLVVWKGPPPLDFAKHPATLLEMAQSAGADTVIIDSLKDVAIKLSDDETGAGYNNARQAALVAGVELLEVHHQTKRGGGGVGKPNTLADVYGSAWITAGAGSVFLLWGDAGDPAVELLHLKQPGEPIGPLDIVHDHHAGTSRLNDDRDPLVLLRAADKLTAPQLARLLYVPDGTRQPKPNEVEKARRILDRLARQGHADKRSQRGDDGALQTTNYHYRPPRHTTPDPFTDPFTADDNTEGPS